MRGTSRRAPGSQPLGGLAPEKVSSTHSILDAGNQKSYCIPIYVDTINHARSVEPQTTPYADGLYDKLAQNKSICTHTTTSNQSVLLLHQHSLLVNETQIPVNLLSAARRIYCGALICRDASYDGTVNGRSGVNVTGNAFTTTAITSSLLIALLWPWSQMCISTVIIENLGC